MASESNPDVKQRHEVEAKQGTARPGLIYVLVGGLVLVLVGFAIVWGLQHH